MTATVTPASSSPSSSAMDTRFPEDQLSPDRDAAKPQQRRDAAKPPASSPRGGARRPAPAPAPAAPRRPPPPAQQQKQQRRSLLERLAAAAGLSTFVGALYVSNTILLTSLALLLSSGLSSLAGWLLLALWLLLASCPLGTGAASQWGFGLPCETHAALTSPAPEFGRWFVRYVTGAAEWYFPVRVVVEGEDEDEQPEEGEDDNGDKSAAAASASPSAHARRHATTLQPDGAYVIGLEPHSVLPLAMPACFSTDSVLCPRALRGQRVHGLASSVCFSVPLIRHLWWFLGIRPVTRRVIARLISGGDDGGGAGAGQKSREQQQQQQEKEEEVEDGRGGGEGSLRRRRRPKQQQQTSDEASAAAAASPAPSPARDRRSVVLIPGGVQECLYMQQPSTGVETAYISTRRGFVRLALRCGADGLVPAFAFGQSHGLSWARPGPPVFSEAFVARVSRSLGALPLALWGRWGTPAPHRKPMVVVVGRPLPLPRPEEWAGAAGEGGDPPPELVQAHLEGYIRAMEALVVRHRDAAGFPETTLRVL